MSKKIWLLVLGVILVMILLPLGVDWLIIGNSFPSNISNSDWVGFFGGYIGALVGALVSLIGIIVTIRFTKAQIDASHAQYEDEKRMNYLPILDCQISQIIDGSVSDAIRMRVEYTQDSTKKLYPMTLIFNICNVGVGAATDLKYGVELNGIKQDGVFWLPNRCVIRSQEIFEQGLVVYVPLNEEFSPTMLLFYEDVLGNKYCKRIDIVIKYDQEPSMLHFFVLKQDKGQLCSVANEEDLYYVVGASELQRVCKTESEAVN